MPQTLKLNHWIKNQAETNIKEFTKEVGVLKKSLEVFESHLKLRNFLVGYNLTLADVTLVSHLITPLQ